MLIELTTGLPCTHFSPASITSHFDESIITGTRAMSGSVASRFRKRVIAAFESSMASSMLTSIICAPFSTCWRATASASSYWPFSIRRANAREPVTLVRSPTFTKSESSSMFIGSSPESRSLWSPAGIERGGRSLTACAMAAMCSGVVPQQPPAMLTKPDCANSPSSDEVISGVSSKPVSLIGFGRPALGYTQMAASHTRESSAMYGRINAAPSAQFNPMVIGFACRTEFQNASTVWPERMRPEASVTVPDTMTG